MQKFLQTRPQHRILDLLFFQLKKCTFSFPKEPFCTSHGLLNISCSAILGILIAVAVSCSFSYDSLIIFHVFRFFNRFILLFALHFSSLSMFRFLASVFQTDDASITAANFTILLLFLFGGFFITQRKLSYLFSDIILR